MDYKDEHRSDFCRKILLRSKDRETSTDNSSNFVVTFREPLEGRYRLNYVSIYNTIYNIDSRNNQVYFTSSTADGAQVATITPGNYTGSTLATELATAMDAVTTVASNPYTVTYSTTTGKLTFTATTGTISFTYGTNTTNSANKVTGFPASDTVTASPKTSPDPIFLGCPLSLGIDIHENSSSNYALTNGQHSTFIVPLQTAFGVYSYNEAATQNAQIFTVRTGTKRLSIKVINTDSNSEASLNGGEWEMMFERLSDWNLGTRRISKRLREDR